MASMDEYYYLSKKSFRALIVNWEQASQYDMSNGKLYCLSDFQAQWLLSNAEYMRWGTRWSNCPCNQTDLDAMHAELEYNLMNCFDTRWMGQLDYVYQRANDEQLELFELEYDVDGIPGINEDTPTDDYNGDDSLNRQKALCMACDTYVRSYLNAWLQQAQLLIGVVSILGVFVFTTPFIGLIALSILGGLAYITQTAINAVNAADAVSDVICCMYSGLYGQAVNQANFIASLDGCAFGIGSNQAIVRDLIASDLNQNKNWYSFLNALGDSWVLLEAGVDYTCACVPEPTWSHSFDFTVTDGGFVVSTSGLVSGNQGVWISGTGWRYGDGVFASNVSRRAVNISRSNTPTPFTKVQLTFDLTKGTWVNPAEQEFNFNVPTLGAINLSNSAMVNGSNQLYEISGSPTNVGSMSIRLLSSLTNNGTFSGSVVLKSLYIEGTGVDPF